MRPRATATSSPEPRVIRASTSAPCDHFGAAASMTPDLRRPRPRLPAAAQRTWPPAARSPLPVPRPPIDGLVIGHGRPFHHVGRAGGIAARPGVGRESRPVHADLDLPELAIGRAGCIHANQVVRARLVKNLLNAGARVASAEKRDAACLFRASVSESLGAPVDAYRQPRWIEGVNGNAGLRAILITSSERSNISVPGHCSSGPAHVDDRLAMLRQLGEIVCDVAQRGRSADMAVCCHRQVGALRAFRRLQLIDRARELPPVVR